MKASDIVNKYISFFEQRGHKRIPNSPLVPQNDPTTLFTSSGMQPLVPYLLGEKHPQGTRLVDVQNVFRAVDIDEIGDFSHTTFFRMLGNWSLGDYFKKEQIPWIYEFITKDLGISVKNLYFTVFEGYKTVEKDTEAVAIWTKLLREAGEDPEKKIYYYGVDKNWWSRSGPPDKMPQGEPGGPSSEIFYDFGAELKRHENSSFKDKECHPNCDCGRYIEIGNSVFMTYKKQADGSLQPLPNPNVDFGGGLERLLIAVEHQPDVFQSSLLKPIVEAIQKETGKDYKDFEKQMRIVTDHLVAATFISREGVKPSNTEQGYVLRRLIRRSLDNFMSLGGTNVATVVEAIVEQYKETDPELVDKFEEIKLTILEETNKYGNVLKNAKAFITKKYKKISEDIREISADDAFVLYSTHGLSPTQIESLGFVFDRQAFADKMEAHQKLSRAGAEQKFRGGLADHQERTIMGHTATHLLHQALRDVLGDHVHQTGSNITTERLRFDFNYNEKLTDEQIKKVENIVNEKIKENLPVHFDMLPLAEAKKVGAIGLFDEKYEQQVKVYFMGPAKLKDQAKPTENGQAPSADEAGWKKEHYHAEAYSKEFCGGPHVEFTGKLKSFKLIKQEALGSNQRRVYAVTGE